MEEQLISFETAKLAKEKGFNIDCLHFYCINSTCNYTEKPYEYSFKVNANRPNKNNFGYGGTTSAPTQSLLQRWLREVHDIIVLIHQYTETKTYFYLINQEYDFEYDNNKLNCKTYEEALEIGLQEALKLIK